MKTLYTAKAKAVGGRNGHAETDDKLLSLQLASPGGSKPGTNPEQLFACGYAACFGSAIEHVAKQQKLDVNNVEVGAEVTLNQDDNGYFIGVTMNVSLPSLDAATAEKLVNDAHGVCPYSKATRGNIKVALRANGQSLRLAA